MRKISVEDLTNYKILPFDLYNEAGELILNIGEDLTPGKLLRLRYVSKLYTDNEDINLEKSFDGSGFDDDSSNPYEIFYKENELNCISAITQQEIKSDFRKAIDNILDNNLEESKTICVQIRDTIVDEILNKTEDILYKSQLKFYGEYDYTHGINVAVLSTALTYKLKMSEAEIKDIALAGLLHDIGKTRISDEILEKQNRTVKECKHVQLHSQIGYRMIKREMKLEENIARVALEHHERNDGSGCPYGISGELISLPSQIIMICDVYDNLISNKGFIKVKTPKEAIKIMLDSGSKWFTPKILYTFVYMSNYNDNVPL